jgi:hypothetical protein
MKSERERRLELDQAVEDCFEITRAWPTLPAWKKTYILVVVRISLGVNQVKEDGIWLLARPAAWWAGLLP